MEKAYDVKDLGERLKKKGLAHSEQAVADTYQTIKEWATESALVSENPYDDLAVPFYKQLDVVVLPQIDKISDDVQTGK